MPKVPGTEAKVRCSVRLRTLLLKAVSGLSSQNTSLWNAVPLQHRWPTFNDLPRPTLTVELGIIGTVVERTVNATEGNP